MDVIIGGVIHRADQKLLVFILTPEDKKDIAAMADGDDTYSCYPSNVSPPEIEARIKESHKLLRRQKRKTPRKTQKAQVSKPVIVKPYRSSLGAEIQ